MCPRVQQDLAHRAEIAERKAIDHRKHKFSAAPGTASSAAKRARSGMTHSSSGHGSGGGSSRQGGAGQGSGGDDSNKGRTDQMGNKPGRAPLLSFGEDEDD